jgi:hypothetical protein
MGGACGAHGGGERSAQGVGGETRERDLWGDPDVYGRIILRWIFMNLEGVVGTGWSWLNRDRWRALVSTVKNLRVP